MRTSKNSAFKKSARETIWCSSPKTRSSNGGNCDLRPSSISYTADRKSTGISPNTNTYKTNYIEASGKMITEESGISLAVEIDAVQKAGRALVTRLPVFCCKFTNWTGLHTVIFLLSYRRGLLSFCRICIYAFQSHNMTVRSFDVCGINELLTQQFSSSHISLLRRVVLWGLCWSFDCDVTGAV